MSFISSHMTMKRQNWQINDVKYYAPNSNYQQFNEMTALPESSVNVWEKKLSIISEHKLCHTLYFIHFTKKYLVLYKDSTKQWDRSIIFNYTVWFLHDFDKNKNTTLFWTLPWRENGYIKLSVIGREKS